MGNFRPAVRIEPHSGLVACPIRLPSRFNPHNRIYVLVFQHLLIRRRPNPKSSVADIAPLTPFRPYPSFAGTALVDDEVRGVSSLDKARGELVDVVVLVPRIVPLSVGLPLFRDVGVVIGDVDSKTPNRGGGVDGYGTFEDFGEDLGRGCKVIVPAKPATVSSVEVDGCVRELELGNGLSP